MSLDFVNLANVVISGVLDRPRLRSHGARSLRDLRRGACRQLRPRRNDDARHVRSRAFVFHVPSRSLSSPWRRSRSSFLFSVTSCTAAVIHPFVTRPEHSQFMLLLAVAIIMTNRLLILFGPDARTVSSTTCWNPSSSVRCSSIAASFTPALVAFGAVGGAVCASSASPVPARRSALAPTTGSAPKSSAST